MKCQYRFIKSPPRVRRARPDNLAIVPGNLLSYKAQWQEVANHLPHEAVLIVLPTANEVQRQTALTVAKILSQAGHHVRVVPAQDFLQKPQAAKLR